MANSGLVHCLETAQAETVQESETSAVKKGAEKENKKSNQDVHKSWRMVYDSVPSRLGDVFGECNVMAFSTMFTVYCLFALHQDT